MEETLEAYREERKRMNERIAEAKNLGIDRFFALDSRAYDEGDLDSRTKELIGLACSLALRCDDCVTYHLIRCVESGFTDPELFEVFNVALAVGGSITIPHLRRAVSRLDEIRGSA